VLALDLLHRQFPYRVLIGREMTPIDICLVRVVTSDAKGCEQGAEFQELRILPGTDDVREHAPGAVIDRMPEPPRSCFGADETPHLIQLGGASWLGAGAAGA
jgi:hypothetical protein